MSVRPSYIVSRRTGTVMELAVHVGSWSRNAIAGFVPRARKRWRLPASMKRLHWFVLDVVTVAVPFVFHARP